MFFFTISLDFNEISFHTFDIKRTHFNRQSVLQLIKEEFLEEKKSKCIVLFGCWAFSYFTEYHKIASFV